MESNSPAPSHQPQQAHQPSHPPAHGESLRRELNLSPNEILIREIHRHPIGVLQIYLTATLALLGLFFGTGLIVKLATSENEAARNALPVPAGVIVALAIGLGLLAILIAWVAIKVYNGNRLYVTNESIIQRIQTSLFHTKEQQITLSNIEDVSYEQNGLLQHLLNFGTIRLSTEGEETTYYFRYASRPKEQAAYIVDAQEQFIAAHPNSRH